MHRSPAPLLQRGITLIESAVAVAVLATAAASALPGLQDLIVRKRLEGRAAQLAADLQNVRTETVARNAPLRVSFFAHSGGSCYLVHTGAKTQCTCSADQAPACFDGAQLVRAVELPAAERLSLSASTGSILFDPLHGTTTPAATVRLGAAPGAIHHVVNVMGRVRSCTPEGRIAGYRSC